MIFKSSWFTGGDFMFLYWFVCCCMCRHWPQTCIHVITCGQLILYLSFLPGLMTLACRSQEEILVDIVPWPWILKVKYWICYVSTKMIWMLRNEKQIYRLNSSPQKWPSVWPWLWPWPWIFKVRCLVTVSWGKMVRLPWNKKMNILIEC